MKFVNLFYFKFLIHIFKRDILLKLFFLKLKDDIFLYKFIRKNKYRKIYNFYIIYGVI